MRETCVRTNMYIFGPRAVRCSSFALLRVYSSNSHPFLGTETAHIPLSASALEWSDTGKVALKIPSTAPCSVCRPRSLRSKTQSFCGPCFMCPGERSFLTTVVPHYTISVLPCCAFSLTAVSSVCSSCCVCFQEIKHGRTAMIGITGMYFQTLVQGQGILSQLGEAFSTPESVAKAGYFFNPL